MFSIFTVGGNSLLSVSHVLVLFKDNNLYASQVQHSLGMVMFVENPPRIASHQCLSNRFRNLECTFQTNTVHTDLAHWNITFSTK